MDAQEAKEYDEVKAERRKRQKELRKERAMIEAARVRTAPKKQSALDVLPAVTAVIESAPRMEQLKIPQPADKVPYVVGHKPAKAKKAKGVGLTKRLEAAISMKAGDIESVRKYCEYAGIDPEMADVGDCLVHNLFHWAMKGSAPHIKELFERIDGKVVKTDAQNASGKMSITDAMNMIEQKPNEVIEEDTPSEATPEKVEEE